MSAPMTDIHIKHVIELAFKVLRADPDRHLADIFGDAKLDPHAALYGQRTIDQVKNWLLKTDIPVILGFDLVDAKLPAVTVNLASSTPSNQFIGDTSIANAMPLEWQQKEVVVPAFTPAGAEFNADMTELKLTLPDDMSFEQKQLVLPGLILRDSKGSEYAIGYDKDYNIIITARSAQAPVDQIVPGKLEVVSPVIDARYNRGAMMYDEQAVVVVHGHASRTEGLWVYYIVMWGLLKFRPLLVGTFGLDLSVPAASDFSKDDSFLGEQVWRRYITMSAKTMWTWEASRQKDVLGLLATIKADPVNTTGQTVTIDPKPPGK